MDGAGKKRLTNIKDALGWLRDPSHYLFVFGFVVLPSLFIGWMAASTDHKVGYLEKLHETAEEIRQTAKEMNAKMGQLIEIGNKLLIVLGGGQQPVQTAEKQVADNKAPLGKAAPCDCKVDTSFDPEFQGGGDWPSDWGKPKAQPRRKVAKSKAVQPITVAEAPRGLIPWKVRSTASGDDRFDARTGFDF